jgi:hypothetical protein
MTHNLSSMHHSFDIELACKYGVEEAILIHHFQHWITYNKRLNRNFHEERTWTYQTVEEICAHFPYLTKEQIRDLIERLCTGKSRRTKSDEIEFEPVLIKGNFNKTNFDKTTWYAFQNEEILTKGQMPKSEKANAQIRSGQMPTPIPHTKTDAKTKQQQEPAADSLYEIFECLNSVEIPQSDKRWLSEHYNEDDVMHAIAWATHPSTKLNKELAAAIKWACKEKPEIPKTQVDVIENNKKYAQEVAFKYNGENGHEVIALGKYIEITCYPYSQCLEYTEHGFKDQLDNELRKRGIVKVPKIT